MQQLVYGERVARTVRLQRAAAEKAAAEACSERLAAGGASTQGALCPTHKPCQVCRGLASLQGACQCWSNLGRAHDMYFDRKRGGA